MYADKLIKLANKAASYLHHEHITNKSPVSFPQKALIILPEFIGDVLLLTPILRNLNYNLKNSVKLDIVGNTNSKNLLETLPYFEDFYIDKDDTGNKVSFFKKFKYDTIFLFNFRFFWALAGYQAEVQQRIGFSLEKMGLENLLFWQKFMTHLIKSSTVYEDKHQIDIYLDMLRTLKLSIKNEYPEVILTEDDIKKADSLIKHIPKPRAVIHVTAGSPGKQWSLDKWEIIIKYLKERYNFNLISTGSPAEKSVYEYLSAKTGIKINNLCGETTIRETIALYRQADLCITLDTAAAHFAAVAGIKNIIVIYGPTNELQWKPYTTDSFVQQIFLNLDCRPCLTRLCHHRKCLAELSPDLVINAVENIII